jgi:tetratricopeptide (TPR) repeat protein
MRARRYDLEAALKFYEKALTISPEDTDLLDGAGELCLECGRSEDALKLFTTSIQLRPEQNAAKYMNMGQLLAGEDSIRHYMKGMELLQADLRQAGEDVEAAAKIRHRLSSGYVSMTEIYMTVCSVRRTSFSEFVSLLVSYVDGLHSTACERLNYLILRIFATMKMRNRDVRSFWQQRSS